MDNQNQLQTEEGFIMTYELLLKEIANFSFRVQQNHIAFDDELADTWEELKNSFENLKELSAKYIRMGEI